MYRLNFSVMKNANKMQIPSFVRNYSNLRAKGIDFIACVAVTDPKMIQSWQISLDRSNHVSTVFVEETTHHHHKALQVHAPFSSESLGVEVAVSVCGRCGIICVANSFWYHIKLINLFCS